MLVKDLQNKLSKSNCDETVVIAIENTGGDIRFFNIQHIFAGNSKDFPTMICTQTTDINYGVLDGEE